MNHILKDLLVHIYNNNNNYYYYMFLLTGDPKQLTEWEKQKELEEFHKISRIYTPNTSLSDKFTHGRDNIEQVIT